MTDFYIVITRQGASDLTWVIRHACILAFSEDADSVERRGVDCTPKNSSPIDRAPGARSKSDEFSGVHSIVLEISLKRLLHLLGSGHPESWLLKRGRFVRKAVRLCSNTAEVYTVPTLTAESTVEALRLYHTIRTLPPAQRTLCVCGLFSVHPF
eukprot:5003138-Prymnesium_polylepis.1